MTDEPVNVLAARILADSPREQAALHRQQAEDALRRQVPVKFLRNTDAAGDSFVGWNAGEVAGFQPHEAERLVKLGFATFDLGAEMEPASRPADVANGAPTAAASGTLTVRFVRPWSVYGPGDEAGFNLDLARELITAGIADGDLPTPIRRTLGKIRDAIRGRG